MASTTGQHPVTQNLRRNLPAEGTAGTGGVYALGGAVRPGTRAVLMADAAITGVANNFRP
jgi:hypothetical protein